MIGLSGTLEDHRLKLIRVLFLNPFKTRHQDLTLPYQFLASHARLKIPFTGSFTAAILSYRQLGRWTLVRAWDTEPQTWVSLRLITSVMATQRVQLAETFLDSSQKNKGREDGSGDVPHGFEYALEPMSHQRRYNIC